MATPLSMYITHLLRDREIQLIRERDGQLRALEMKYINYINALLQQKLVIAEKIRYQYDDLIKHNASIYVHITHKMITNSITHTMMNTTHNPIKSESLSDTQPCINDIDQQSTTHSEQRAINLRSIWESSDDEDHTSVSSTDFISPMPRSFSTPQRDTETPFPSAMTIQEAEDLSINDIIDHRDIVGCYIGATIIDKKGTNLKIHYHEWDKQWDTWSDYNTELYRFARHESVSQRARHRLYDLNEGDCVDVNPIRHRGWKIGRIHECDGDSGQIKIAYVLDDLCHYVWTHIDNKEEIEPLHTLTQQNIDNKEQHKYQSSSFECIFCERSFNTNDALRKHVQMDHSERPVLCKHCPYASSKKGTKIHQKQHTQDAPFKCTLCVKLFRCSTSFRLKGDLTGHLRRVHKVKVKEDTKTWVSRDKRKRSKRKKMKSVDVDVDAALKQNKINYECIFCDVSCKTDEDLRKHIKCDHSERKYCCTYCPQAFTTQKGLKLHEIQHTVERRFVCDICEALFECHTSFGAQSAYTGHLRRVHKIDGKSSNISVSGHKRKILSSRTGKKVKKKMKLSKNINNKHKTDSV